MSANTGPISSLSMSQYSSSFTNIRSLISNSSSFSFCKFSIVLTFCSLKTVNFLLDESSFLVSVFAETVFVCSANDIFLIILLVPEHSTLLSIIFSSISNISSSAEEKFIIFFWTRWSGQYFSPFLAFIRHLKCGSSLLLIDSHMLKFLFMDDFFLVKLFAIFNFLSSE
ncbi:MAG: hypothetical protein Satyrvirus19_13 [Satyrvirus sp.]|uniref:Uncharacterized protein n=1 Tax=Satyrvirus sp. TaxID=2487771 RepID=A0A3G5AGR4_9VIRU|nr:MAG: hypothetical protein Satyrvirus19_13 [Satyrvirus sp.]